MDHSIDNAHIARALVVPTAQTVAAPGFAAVTTVRDARKRNGHDTHSTVVSALKDLSNGGESNSSAVVVDERVYQERVEMCEFLVQCAASLLLDQVRTRMRVCVCAASGCVQLSMQCKYCILDPCVLTSRLTLRLLDGRRTKASTLTALVLAQKFFSQRRKVNNN